MSPRPPSVDRRTVLRTAAGGVAAASTAGLAGTTAAQDNPFGDWFTESAKGGAVGNFDGVVDRTGQDAVTVEVGADGNGGTFAFGPAAIRISPGTTVTFEWVSDTHNVLVEEQPDGADWQGVSAIENTGFSHEHTFDTEGVYTYYCEPHLSLGMKGGIVVESGGGDGGDGGGGGGVAAEYGDWFTESAKGGAVGNFDGTTVDRTGQDAVTVEVGADGNGGTFAFEPPAVRVSPGTTVTFEWVSDTHNVLVEEQPDGAGWEGVEAIENTGFSHEHTFETRGVYTYYCEPHLSLGMKGAVVVGPAPGQAGGGAGRPADPGGVILPIAFALLGLLALPVLLGLQAMRSPPAGAAAEGPRPVVEAAQTDDHVVEELGHDEFDPTGTAALIVAYFAVLAIMWVFMYFVEFLGNGPTVIG